MVVQDSDYKFMTQLRRLSRILGAAKAMMAPKHVTLRNTKSPFEVGESL